MSSMRSAFTALSFAVAFSVLACSESTPEATEESARPDAPAAADAGGTTPVEAGTSPPIGDAGPEPAFDAKLYTLPETTFAVTRIGDAIDALVAAKPALANVIVFVHGRSCGGGGEPKKSLESVVPELETDYAAGAIMFFWPGSDDGCPLGFPEDKARAAGPALRATIASLAAWSSAHPATYAKLKLSLLTHSLGNIVLESALASKTGAPPSLFASSVLNSSATALAGHAPWLSNLDFAERVYVTVNNDDKVLLAAGVGRGPRLGRELGTETLTSRAAYVDFTAAGVNHQYYVSSGQKGQHMKDFYQAVLAGRAYDLAGSTAITKRTVRDGATIYTFDGK